MVTNTKPLFLLVVSATLWLGLRRMQRSRECHNDDDDDDEHDDGNVSNTTHSVIYRRDTSLDFHPNNCNNWTHFETTTVAVSGKSSLSPDSYHVNNILRTKENNKLNSMSTTVSPHYNAQRCLPSKLILIRHGQSEGNVDESLYATKPDNAMGLTKLGWEMARMAGKALHGDGSTEGLLPPGETVHFIVSPYVRTVETFHGIASAWIDPEKIELEGDQTELIDSHICNNGGMNVDSTMVDIDSSSNKQNNNLINNYNGSYHNTSFLGINKRGIDDSQSTDINNYNNHRCKRLMMWYSKLMDLGLTWHEDPRIREQDFGNYQDPKIIKKCKAERHKFGSFYYRYPHGESASDVYDRVSTFLDSLWRSFESGRAQNYVIVAHGVSIRVFLARYFRYSIDQFHMLANPKNCEIIVLGHDGLGRLKLDGRCELDLCKRPICDKNNSDENGSEGGKSCRVNGLKDDVGDNRGQKSSHAAPIDSAPIISSSIAVTGYKRHTRLRTIPPQWLYPRNVRICYNET